ncbi:hypothetical protein [Streptomyces sp. NPDC055692]|uniref:LexA family protein n=1 Tax=Streptomyces sp. NPDC055692 TaxID=3155683 RepID=UPI0034353DD3
MRRGGRGRAGRAGHRVDGTPAAQHAPEHLSEREEEILRCIRRWIEDKGEGPSGRQLAHAVGMRSTASVAYHLANLERSGALIRDGRGWNTCRLGH